ncbi:hypothetical protein PM8797T_21103 [Gimesia maris DSM 8797]|nr:hypothetical protein PM8797T_21103 [Gimesia maris DSM 8797]
MVAPYHVTFSLVIRNRTTNTLELSFSTLSTHPSCFNRNA